MFFYHSMQGGWWVGDPKPNLLLTIIYFSNAPILYFLTCLEKSFSQLNCERTFAKKQSFSRINLLHSGIYFFRAVGICNMCAHSAAVLCQACAAAEFRRHGVSSICILTVFVSMVHRRSALGAWKHAQRSYDRGYLAHPPVFFGDASPSSACVPWCELLVLSHWGAGIV